MISLYLVLGLLTIISMAFLIFPSLDRQDHTRSRLDYDLAVYRDQSAELQKQITSGLIDTSESESAREEIARRVLAAESFNRLKKGSAKKTAKSWLVIVPASLLIVAGSFGLYALLGSPKTPSQPFAGRAKSDPFYPVLLNLQQELKLSETDATAQRLTKIGSLYLRLGRPSEASDAFQAALKKDPTDSAVFSKLGESWLLIHSGVMTPESVGAFRKAFTLDPLNFQAEFFLGLAEEQAGDPLRAIAIWKDALRNAPPHGPIATVINAAITSSAKRLQTDPSTVPPRAP